MTKVTASEHKYVNAGDWLFQLDTAQLEAAIETAQANYEKAQQAAGSTNAAVSGAQARVTGAQAALAKAPAEYVRQKTLFDKGDVAQAALDQATNTLDQAAAALQEAQSALAASRNQAGEAGDSNTVVRAALGQLTQAQIALGYATVTAPAVGGWVANISLWPEQVVGAGQSLFSIVEDGQWWVDGTFKETDLLRIRPGQPVSNSIDIYPDTILSGEIETIGAGSGAIFSLLPPENATGNWVKVTQRFPVRISSPVPTARWPIILAVVLTAVLEVLDSTIVNVALPHMKAAPGITNDQTVWILISYIVASVVVMPLTGFSVRMLAQTADHDIHARFHGIFDTLLPVSKCRDDCVLSAGAGYVRSVPDPAIAVDPV